MERNVRQLNADTAPDPLTFVYITKAYNRGEISLEEWLAQTRQWAEAVIKYHRGESRRADDAAD